MKKLFIIIILWSSVYAGICLTKPPTYTNTDTAEYAGLSALSSNAIFATVAALSTNIANYTNSNFIISIGQPGGQYIYGGTGASENLRLYSTSHATKGKIFLNSCCAFDSALSRLGIGTNAPQYSLHIYGGSNESVILVENTNSDDSEVIVKNVSGNYSMQCYGTAGQFRLRNNNTFKNILLINSNVDHQAIVIQDSRIRMNDSYEDVDFQIRKDTAGLWLDYDAGNDTLAINSKTTITNHLVYQNAYADLYLHGATADYTIATAGVYVQVSNLTLSVETGNDTYIDTIATNGSFTIGANGAGVYKITASLTFTGTVNSIYSNHIFTNGIECDSIGNGRKIGTGGDIGNAGLTGMLKLNSGDIVTLRVTSAGTPTVTYSELNFNLYRISY